MKSDKNLMDIMSQFAIPSLTIGGQIMIALKYPQYGLLLNLIAQPFWLYSTWKSYKKAGQVGIFINTVAFAVVTLLGLLNYWFL